jgi:hypothetical protein
VYTPTSYDGGLTFLTGVDDDRQPNEIPIVVSAILVAVGGCYIFWRRNVVHPAGRHRRVSGPHRHVDGVRG